MVPGRRQARLSAVRCLSVGHQSITIQKHKRSHRVNTYSDGR